jgi:abhydrolase domain-containing protein 12
LGAWFTFADNFYHEATIASSSLGVNFTETDISRVLQTHNTILYFHGNAASRAAPHRVNFYSKWTSRAKVNVLAIDYRGFADSEGTPTEEGLGVDAKTSWDWLVSRGAKPAKILIFGQSLGTGVAAKLAYALSTEGD